MRMPGDESTATQRTLSARACRRLRKQQARQQHRQLHVQLSEAQEDVATRTVGVRADSDNPIPLTAPSQDHYRGKSVKRRRTGDKAKHRTAQVVVPIPDIQAVLCLRSSSTVDQLYLEDFSHFLMVVILGVGLV